MNLKIEKKFDGRAVVTSPKRIGQIVRQVRKVSKLSQREAAFLCGVGVRFLSDFENGKESVHLGKALHVLRAFGLLIVLKKKKLPNEQGS